MFVFQGSKEMSKNLAYVTVFVLIFSFLSVRSSQYSAIDKKDDVLQHVENFDGSCTAFAVTDGEHVMFGNNEDFKNPETYIWTVPSSKESFGGIYFGYKYGRPQGGINEKGLAFDALALPEVPINPHPELLFRGPSDTVFLGKIMSHCGSVEEAIQYSQKFNWGTSLSFQVLLADASGDAVIISAGPDGELAFTRKDAGDGYLIGTNFNRAFPENHSGTFPCWRYDTAESMLSQIGKGSDLSVDYLAGILDAVHMEGAEENTLYSNIFDMKTGDLYLYYWHQYNEVVTLNVAEQIDQGLSPTRISDLFSKATVIQADEEQQKYIAQNERNAWLNQHGRIIIGGGLLVIVLGFSGMIFYFRRRRKLRV